MVGIPLSWLPPAWKGRGRIEHPVNWAQLPEFDVGVALLQQKTDYGHKNTWSIYIRKFNETDVVSMPVMAQSVVTSSAGSTQTITSDATFTASANCIEAIGAGADGGIGAGTTTSGGGGGGGAYTRIVNMPCATPGTTPFFVRVGAHAQPAGTIGDSWLTQTTPGTTYPVSAEVGLGAKGGAPLAAASTATGSAGGALASAYTNPSTGSVAKSGGTGGASTTNNASGGGGGGAGGQDASSATPGTGPTAGSPGNGGLNGGGTAGPAGNGAGAAAGNGTNINGTVGSGGGGGGGNAGPSTGGAGGLYGGGGGGGGRSNGVKGLGAQGIVVISWQLPVGKATDWAQPTPKAALPGIELKTWARPGGQLLLLGKDRIYRGVGQVPTYDWQNPRGPQFPVDLRTWLQGGAPRFYPAASTDNPAGLDSFNPWGAAYPVILRTWTNAGIQSVASPLVQSDWPNPWGATYPISLRTWINGVQIVANYVPSQASFLNPWGAQPSNSLYAWVVTPQLTPAAVPFSQLDWPNPRGPQFPVDLRTWVYEGTLNTAGPFNQLDWPNPTLRVWSERGAANQVIRIDGVKPFNQLDWPNPVLRTRLELGTFYQPTIAVGVKPFNQSEWPNPVPRSRVDVTWISQGTTAGLLPPFYQTAWPNPYTRARIDVGWASVGIQAVATPFYQVDWPNPGFRARVEYGTFNPIITAAGVQPFNQLDWPNPVLRVRLEYGTFNPVITAAGVQPFSQLDWPNPLTRVRVDVTWLNAGIQAAPAPFYQLDWPNPRGVRLALGWLNNGITSVIAPAPFYQTDWVNPNKRTSPEVGWLNQVIRIDGVKPILQSDWPNPIVRVRLELGSVSITIPSANTDNPAGSDSFNPWGAAYPISLRTWTNAGINTVVTPPFHQLDWPNPTRRLWRHIARYNRVIHNLNPAAPQVWVNPRGPTYPISLLTWTQSPRVAPPVAPPFYQTAWPNPFLRVPLALTWLNPVIRFDGLKPIVPQVWVNPYGPKPTYPVSLLTWTQSPVPQVPTSLPCSVTGWAVPWGPVYPVSLRSWPQINGTIRIPVGPKPRVTYDYPNPRGPVYPVALRTWLQSQQRPDATHDTSNLPCIPGVWFNPWGPALRQLASTFPFRYDPAPVDNSLLPSQASFLNPWGPQFPVDLRTWIQVPESATAAQVDITHRGPLFYRLVPRSHHAALQLRLGTLVQTLVPPNVSHLASLADFLNPWGPRFNVNLMLGSRGRVPSTITPATFPRVASVFFNPPGPRFNISILLGVKGRIPDFPQPDKIPCQANFFNPWGPKHHNNLFGYISGVNPDSFNSDYTVRVPLITRINLRSYHAALGAQLPQNRVVYILGNYPCTPAAYFPPWGPRRSKELLTWVYNWEGQYGPVAPPPKTAFDYPNPRGAEYAITLRTWLLSPFARQDTSLGLGGFPQFDWPVPRGPQFPVDLRTQLNFAQQVIPAGPPPPNTDWPNPRGATPATTLRTWLDATKQQLIGQDSLPLRQVDWPNPRGAQRPVADFVQGLNVALLRTFPNAQLDWPNPRGPQRPVMDWVSGIDIAAVFFIPIRQPDWPVPRGAQRPASEYQWLNGNTINIPPTPLSQTDWPNPRGARPASILNTWINNTQQQLIGKDALPSRQSEWPVPKGPTPGVSLRTIDHNNTRYYGKDTFFGLAGAPNFNWPNPWGPKPLDIYTMVNGFSLPSAPVPPPDPSVHNLRFLADVGPMTAR